MTNSSQPAAAASASEPNESEHVEPPAPPSEPLDEVIAGIIDALLNLADRVQVLEANCNTAAIEPDDFHETAGESSGFDAWLTWLLDTYQLHKQLSESTMALPAVQQELQALHASWTSAYSPDGSPLPGPAASHWHDTLQRTVDHAAEWRTLDIRNP